MISTILANLWAFALSMPTNMIILLIICIIMKVVFKYKVKDCLFVIIGYLAIGLLLALFGITMPSFLTIGRWLGNLIKSIFGSVW
jgi:hypothetical protein